MKVSVVKESYPDECRVALIPANVTQLTKAGIDVIVEEGAGERAGYLDEEYLEKGATVIDRAGAFEADVVLQVRSYGTNQQAGRTDLEDVAEDQIIVGTCDPLGSPQAVEQFAETGATSFSLELIPRITRAQSMDVLSSQATIAGYRAVLLGAAELPKMFPMLMTAAGTISPARVFVIGAGVAGLQAIATAKRLGAVVYGYDVRPVVREQVESLGGKFVEFEELAPYTTESEDKGGYAKAMDEDFYNLQRELIAKFVKDIDLIISTAAIPGRQSPLLVTEAAVDGMAAGSVVIDLAAERGGNCECSEPDARVEHNGVAILGPTNLPAEIPHHASQMFSNNVTKFLLNMVQDGELDLNLDDEIIRDTLITHDGEVINNRIREMLGLEPLPDPEPEVEESAADNEPKDNLAPIPFDDGDTDESEEAEAESDDDGDESEEGEKS